MAQLRTSVRTALRLSLVAIIGIPALLGCVGEDVGSACNHGDVEPPESKLVTFPALSCSNLLCVYADEDEPPTGDCTDNSGCGDDPKFECVQDDPAEPGICKLRVDYVLERSMCSKQCSDDNDCKDGGPTEKVVVEDTNCATGFKCARIQTLGKFCCQKLCVCNDDLGVTTDIDAKCSTSTQEGCCVDGSGVALDPLPEACGQS